MAKSQQSKIFIIVAYSPGFALLTAMVGNWARTQDANLVYNLQKYPLSPAPFCKCERRFSSHKNFGQAVPNIKSDVVLALNRTDFCQASKLSDFTLKWLKRAERKPAKMFNCFAWQSSREDGERRRFERQLFAYAISKFKTWWSQSQTNRFN